MAPAAGSVPAAEARRRAAFTAAVIREPASGPPAAGTLSARHPAGTQATGSKQCPLIGRHLEVADHLRAIGGTFQSLCPAALASIVPVMCSRHAVASGPAL
jgi:hypothetical protein